MKRTLLTIFFSLAGLALAALSYIGIRQTAAIREIEKEWQAELPPAYELATTSKLEIIPLYEEASRNDDLISGHGVSYLIRTDAATILLDVGNNPDDLSVAPFMHNMQQLGIDWDEIDRIVISHLHPDHIGGIKAWQQKMVSFGELPGGLGDRLIFVPDIVKNKPAVHATIPTLPSPDVATTGVISYPEVWPLALRDPKGHEQALVVHVAGQGLVLITGCGHPTLEKLVERAESLYDAPIVGVVGGLHYEGQTTAEVAAHIEFLGSRNPQLVALSPHDSSEEAIEAFQMAFPQVYQDIAVGQPIQFPLP
jgi:7,8-dihydropterin-6-yl-methyl-4-(beta-D-ribofuranosyl)aminobenzene 5'-phosphate synthase